MQAHASLCTALHSAARRFLARQLVKPPRIPGLLPAGPLLAPEPSGSLRKPESSRPRSLGSSRRGQRVNEKMPDGRFLRMPDGATCCDDYGRNEHGRLLRH